MRPRFFSQKIAQKLPLKKIPSTAANATILWAKERSLHGHGFVTPLNDAPFSSKEFT
jgi:hypothetical protein